MNGQQETLGANAPPKPKTSKARLDAANDRARARRSIVAVRRSTNSPLTAPRPPPPPPSPLSLSLSLSLQGGKGKKAAAASATPAVQPVAVKTKKGTVKLNAAALKVNNAKAPSAEILEELAARFVLNCPAEELNSFERILFLVEQAHWYYEDFVREEEEHKHRLKSMSLKQFAGLMFNKCAPLRRYKDKVDDIYKAFTNYKLSVPVGGIIILNPDMSKVLMVKTWKGSSWGFPKGKINKDEPESVLRGARGVGRGWRRLFRLRPRRRLDRDEPGRGPRDRSEAAEPAVHRRRRQRRDRVRDADEERDRRDRVAPDIDARGRRSSGREVLLREAVRPAVA